MRDVGLKIVADEDALAEAIANLVQNAAKYADESDSIDLVVRKFGDWAVFSVQDRGPGLPPEAVERAFEPFFRLVPSGRPDPGGSGLGLTIARRIAVAHGGRLGIFNRSAGGARFSIIIPLERARP